MCRLGTDRLTSRCKFPAKETQSAEVRTLRQVGAFRAVRRHIPARATQVRRGSSLSRSAPGARRPASPRRLRRASRTPRRVDLRVFTRFQLRGTSLSSPPRRARRAAPWRPLRSRRRPSARARCPHLARRPRRRRGACASARAPATSPALSRAERSSRRRFARPRSRAAASRAGLPRVPPRRRRGGPRGRGGGLRRRGRGDRGDRVRGRLRGRDGRRDGRVVLGLLPVLPVRGRLLQHRAGRRDHLHQRGLLERRARVARVPLPRQPRLEPRRGDVRGDARVTQGGGPDLDGHPRRFGGGPDQDQEGG